MENNKDFNEEIANDDVKLEQEITNDSNELLELTEEQMKGSSGGACKCDIILKKFKLGRMYRLLGDVLNELPSKRCRIVIYYGFGSNDIQLYHNNTKVKPRTEYYISDAYPARIGFYSKGPTSGGRNGAVVASTTLRIYFLQEGNGKVIKEKRVNINVIK